MLLRYRLSDEARRRMFLDGQTPAQFNTLEIDLATLRRSDEREILTRSTRVRDPEDKARTMLLNGEYDALTLRELVTELQDPTKK